MKKMIWVLVFLLSLPSLIAVGVGEIPISWTEVRSKYNWQKPVLFPESESVDLFESILYSDGRVFLQTRDTTRQTSILVWNLESGESTKLPWKEGRVTGWTECRGNLLVQTAKTLWDLDSKTFSVKRKLSWPDKGKSWQDIVCLDNQIYRLAGNQLEVYNLNSGELESKILLPFPSVQRMTKRSETEVFLISSFWGNSIQVFSPKDQTNVKELKFPVTHRSLFKLVVLPEDRFLIFDPLTKTYGEWIGFGNSIFPLTTSSLEVAAGAKGYRFSPIQNQIEYQFQLTALVDIPETKFHFVLPKENIASQTLREESFGPETGLEVDAAGNRSINLTVKAMKAGDTKDMTVYRALLTRYKIQWNLDPTLNLPSGQTKEEFQSYMLDDWFLKMNSDIVLEKRKTLFEENRNLKEILTKTQEYVSSIPYKSGSFESAPKVIEKNNGGCTEHSYVTMALLRGLGIPSRLVWNYLPTESSKEITFNHKFVEVWVEGFGWIPMEPLAAPRSKPGITHARHVVFAGLSGTNHPKIAGGDRLVQLSKEQLGLAKKIKFKLVVAKLEMENEELEGTEERNLPQKTNRALNSGEDMVVP
ncbi:transglutaminase-like domain-containing protein [Leptospira perdikensis]|uniref:Transglutaminase domain-containing protein n=1 Tax=Leptospira perdikensis TaxID=2484948 RepID=A0A4R9JE35_9LEPT|nr:transglutaminase-like domain-containing protein [Leptospira perdikensis]TGL37656.1 transglutaminase domain-containing protein [Leptospira perdikensis]